MREQKTPFIRVYNMAGEKMLTLENVDNVEATITQMESLMPFISSYGKVIIEAADDKIKARSYQKAYKWNLEFTKPVVAGVVHPLGMTIGNIPKEYMHQDIVAAQLKNIEQRMDHEKELRKMQDQIKEKDNSDPMKNIEKIAPAFLYLMGKPLAEVQTFAALYSNPAAIPAGGIRGPQANTLIFSDVEKLTDEEKKKKCQDLLDELSKYATVEEMIILQSKLITKLKADPKFMQTVFLYI